ncbi:MAG: hypothetical protein Q8Q31_05400 [Nanoarchaeota archaeon]|nr:hypothetical protein [Nanoarchaeota archaeon]
MPLPYFPEKHFTKVPKHLSSSPIKKVTIERYLSGIVLAREEIREALHLYLAEVDNHPRKQKVDTILRKTLCEISRGEKEKEAKGREEEKLKASDLRKTLAQSPFVEPNLNRDICQALDSVEAEIQTQPWTVEGKVYPGDPFSPEKFRNYLGKEISIIKVGQLYSLHVLGPDNGDIKERERERNKKESILAELLKKQRTPESINITVQWGVVNDAWYNLPLGRFLEQCELSYRWMEGDRIRGRESDSSPQPLNKKVIPGSVYSHIKAFSSSSGPSGFPLGFRLCLPFEQRLYDLHLDFGGATLHTTCLPHAVDESEEMEPEEKKNHRYTHLRGTNIVGPAWEQYRAGGRTKLSPPYMEIRISPASSIPYIFEEDLPLVELAEMQRFESAGEILLSRIVRFQQKGKNKIR